MHARTSANVEVKGSVGPDGQIPGPQEWEALARRLRRQLSTRIDELDRLLGELGRT